MTHRMCTYKTSKPNENPSKPKIWHSRTEEHSPNVKRKGKPRKGKQRKNTLPELAYKYFSHNHDNNHNTSQQITKRTNSSATAALTTPQKISVHVCHHRHSSWKSIASQGSQTERETHDESRRKLDPTGICSTNLQTASTHRRRI